MRMIYCLFLLLPACAPHAVRCDGHFLPINMPAAHAASGDPTTSVPRPITPRLP